MHLAGDDGGVPGPIDAAGSFPRGICPFSRRRCGSLSTLCRDAFRRALSGHDGRGSLGQNRDSHFGAD